MNTPCFETRHLAKLTVLRSEPARNRECCQCHRQVFLPSSCAPGSRSSHLCRAWWARRQDSGLPAASLSNLECLTRKPSASCAPMLQLPCLGDAIAYQGTGAAPNYRPRAKSAGTVPAAFVRIIAIPNAPPKAITVAIVSADADDVEARLCFREI